MPMLDYARPLFDADVVLDPGLASQWPSPGAALSAVHGAIEAMAGVGRVSVGFGEDASGMVMQVSISEARGSQLGLDAAARDRIARLVQARARLALSAVREAGTAQRRHRLH